MNRILMIGIDGLDTLLEDNKITQYPSLNAIIEKSSRGLLENDRVLPWDLAWSHALSGVNSSKVGKHEMLMDIFPKMGVSIRLIGSPFEEVLEMQSADDLINHESDLILSGICQKPVDRMDVLLISLSGFSKIKQLGGKEDDYWKMIDHSLSLLLDDQTENTINIIFTPNQRCQSSKGININVWLLDRGYLIQDASGSVDKGKSECWYDQESKGLKFSSDLDADKQDMILNELEKMKIFAKRGGDIKAIKYGDLYEYDDRDVNDPDVYIYPRNHKVYISASMIAEKSNGDNRYMNTNPKAVQTPNGMIFISGYQVIENGDLNNITLLAIAPTVMDILTINPIWKMHRHSFKNQFCKIRTSEGTSSDDDGAEAVRSRLEALGY